LRKRNIVEVTEWIGEAGDSGVSELLAHRAALLDLPSLLRPAKARQRWMRYRMSTDIDEARLVQAFRLRGQKDPVPFHPIATASRPSRHRRDGHLPLVRSKRF